MAVEAEEAMFNLTARLRRTMPRNPDVMALCERAERLSVAAVAKHAATAVVPGTDVPATKVVPGTECPICRARRKAETARKKRQRATGSKRKPWKPGDDRH